MEFYQFLYENFDFEVSFAGWKKNERTRISKYIWFGDVMLGIVYL